ncbi:MAG TPA: protein-glutamate O-methyltransferase [bacterium]|nr:protein-glutamate O-methyltransferase [bacterium]HPN43204.1 protein-glutamate O-methyltransferase [bacterium]
MMVVDLMTLDLPIQTFDKISKLVYQVAGINLPPEKIGLVKSRLMKRLRSLNLSTFESYLEYVNHESSGQELTKMIDIITTNKTDFFRELQHFNFMREKIIPGFQKKQPVRIWSAGCSIGAEPYTIAIVLAEAITDLQNYDIKILATDISTEVLKTAKAGEYEAGIMEGMPDNLLKKYFFRKTDHNTIKFQVKDSIRSMIKYANLNLMGEWPMKGPFDLIFCRNVMIYFDKHTRQVLVERFYNLLANEGYFFVGHSESLTTSSHTFKYIQPAVYQK